MNANLLAHMLGMNPENSQKLQSAWNEAQRLSGNVNNLSTAKQALQAVGMGSEAIQRAGKLLNSPVAAIVAKACGANINEARNAINSLLGHTSTITSIPSDIAKLKAGLQQLKG